MIFLAVFNLVLMQIQLAIESATCVICEYEGAECICLEGLYVPRFEEDGGVEK